MMESSLVGIANDEEERTAWDFEVKYLKMEAEISSETLIRIC
jgi:hypothetical protein